jgi:peroxin-5
MQDHRLWNRYGSCLSNGSKPEEALAAYREALRLRPTYTRAVYNVAVACINIGAYKEAVEHLLDALASQNATEGEKSDQLWTTLSRAFMMMVRHLSLRLKTGAVLTLLQDRQDLSDLTKTRPNIDVFKQEGFDFVSTAAPLHASGS